MEIFPIGPVVFLDTAGIDDLTTLGKERVTRTMKKLGSIDIALIVLEGNVWTEFEDALVAHCTQYNIPTIFVVNKVDLCPPHPCTSSNARRFLLTSCVALRKGMKRGVYEQIQTRDHSSLSR